MNEGDQKRGREIRGLGCGSLLGNRPCHVVIYGGLDTVVIRLTQSEADVIQYQLTLLYIRVVWRMAVLTEPLSGFPPSLIKCWLRTECPFYPVTDHGNLIIRKACIRRDFL